MLRLHSNRPTLLHEIGHKTKFMACNEGAVVLSPMNDNRGIPLMVTKKRFVIGCILLTTFSVTGCQTDSELLASERERATQTALRRGQFELDCPQAKATLLSSNLLDQGRLGAYLQAEYTLGVAGCGQRRTYTVICRFSDSACTTLPTYPLPN